MIRIILMIMMLLSLYLLSRLPDSPDELMETCEEWIKNNPEPNDAYCEEE